MHRRHVRAEVDPLPAHEQVPGNAELLVHLKLLRPKGSKYIVAFIMTTAFSSSTTIMIITLITTITITMSIALITMCARILRLIFWITIFSIVELFCLFIYSFMSLALHLNTSNHDCKFQTPDTEENYKLHSEASAPNPQEPRAQAPESAPQDAGTSTVSSCRGAMERTAFAMSGTHSICTKTFLRGFVFFSV